MIHIKDKIPPYLPYKVIPLPGYKVGGLEVPDVIKFPTSANAQSDLEERKAFSCDILQTDGGMVLIDACVSMELAIEFMKLIDAYASKEESSCCERCVPGAA